MVSASLVILSESEDALQLLLELSPLFGIIIGFMSAIILVTAIIILICKINRRNNQNDSANNKYSPNDCTTLRSMSKALNDGNFSELHDTKSPDIIPPSVEFTGMSSAFRV